jgi:hydroxyethylthiazole kinase
MQETITLTPGNRLVAMRAQRPLVQCITNYVAMNVAANVMLASGASPAMVHAVEEAGEFAGIASALTVNIGTLSSVWLEGMHSAVAGAKAAGKPWVLDPVAHFATAFRREAITVLLEQRPTVIRGNASEIIALGGGTSRGQGVDSRDSVEQAEAAAVELARRSGAVVAATGVVDFVTDGERSARVAGGSALMPDVTALGCALTCLVGAFVASDPVDPFEATLAALATYAVAGEAAALGANGPGSFAWRFLDALAAVDGEMLDTRARIARL